MTIFFSIVAFILGALACWLWRDRLDEKASKEYQSDDNYASRKDSQ